MSKKVKDEFDGQKPYEVDKLSKFPSWLIFLLLKYWAAAAAVFFSVIGGLDIGFSFEDANQDPASVLASYIATVAMIALFMTLFVNYIVRPTVRLMYNRRNNTYRYNMVNCKGILSLFLCLIYHFILSIILFFITVFLSSRGWVLDPFGTTEGAGIEPFTYGFCYLAGDFVFLFIKNVIVSLYQKHQYKKQMLQEE